MNAPRETLKARLTPLAGGDAELLGVVIVDHGSRRDASNALLLRVAELFRQQSGMPIVEPAHMELAEPSIATAFDRCVARGATRVVVMPYFLGPGRHWDQDIPHLSARAAERHPGVTHLVTAPLGIDPLIAAVMEDRIAVCLANAAGEATACNACEDGKRCR